MGKDNVDIVRAGALSLSVSSLFSLLLSELAPGSGLISLCVAG